MAALESQWRLVGSFLDSFLRLGAAAFTPWAFATATFAEGSLRRAFILLGLRLDFRAFLDAE